MPTDEEIKKVLEEMKKMTPEYKPELKTATRAEYVTMVKKMKKKRGCPFAVLTFIMILMTACNMSSNDWGMVFLFGSLALIGIGVMFFGR